MRSLRIESVAPALVVVAEVEAPLRVYRLASEAEEHALDVWVAMSPMTAVVADAVAVERRRWERVSRRSG